MYVCINMSTNTVKHILTAYNEYINDKPNQFTYTRPSRFSPILNDEIFIKFRVNNSYNGIIGEPETLLKVIQVDDIGFPIPPSQRDVSAKKYSILLNTSRLLYNWRLKRAKKKILKKIEKDYPNTSVIDYDEYNTYDPYDYGITNSCIWCLAPDNSLEKVRRRLVIKNGQCLFFHQQW